MKLIPQAKPVRIRISCNGQEHFSLASLRKSFRCNAVSELMDAPLVKWLKQQNESEVANRVKLLIDRKEKCSPVELVSAFFAEEGIDKVDSPLSLFDFWLQHGYQYNAIRFVEDCYQTYKVHPDFDTLFHKYLHLDDDEQQRNVLFLLNEEIDTNLAGIPLAITFMYENGYKNEANDFIRKHQKLFANEPKLTPFLQEIKQKQRAANDKTSNQSVSPKMTEGKLKEWIHNNERIQESLKGYDISNLRNIMHMRFGHHNDNELALCMAAAVDAKNGKRIVIPDGYNDKGYVLAFLQSVGSTIDDIKSLTYRNRRGFYDGRTTFYHIYDLVIYNILRKLVGIPIFYPDHNAATSINLCAAYYKSVEISIPSTAIAAIRMVCDSYIFTEKEFKKRHSRVPYVFE